MKGFFREFKRINWAQTFFGSKKRFVATCIIFIPLFVGAVSFGYKFYLSQNPAVIYAHKITTMQQQISKSISLPKGETPTVATITDRSILPKENFFSKAQNGDKIFMYKKHKLAVLYRPSTGQVITEAALVFADVTPSPVKHLTGPGSQAVAGASTSASSVQGTSATSSQNVVSPSPVLPVTSSNSRTNTYQPQGKILIQPQK